MVKGKWKCVIDLGKNQTELLEQERKGERKITGQVTAGNDNECIS